MAKTLTDPNSGPSGGGIDPKTGQKAIAPSGPVIADPNKGPANGGVAAPRTHQTPTVDTTNAPTDEQVAPREIPRSSTGTIASGGTFSFRGCTLAYTAGQRIEGVDRAHRAALEASGIRVTWIDAHG